MEVQEFFEEWEEEFWAEFIEEAEEDGEIAVQSEEDCIDSLDVDLHLVRWIAAFLTNRNQRVTVGEALSPPIWLNDGTPQETKLAPLLFCIPGNRMASNCINRVKYVDDATAMEFVPRLSPSYLNFTVSDICSFVSSRGIVLNSKKCKEMCISFLQYCPFPPAPLLVGSSLIEKVSCYKLLGFTSPIT